MIRISSALLDVVRFVRVNILEYSVYFSLELGSYKLYAIQNMIVTHSNSKIH